MTVATWGAWTAAGRMTEETGRKHETARNRTGPAGVEPEMPNAGTPIVEKLLTEMVKQLATLIEQRVETNRLLAASIQGKDSLQH